MNGSHSSPANMIAQVTSDVSWPNILGTRVQLEKRLAVSQAHDASQEVLEQEPKKPV